MMSKRGFLATLLLAGMFFAASSRATYAADPTIELVAMVEQEIVDTDERGDVVTKRIEASKVVPGDEVIYTTRYANVGDDAAQNVVISNPIPEHMRFQTNSAFGDGAAVVYSIDGGTVFDSPENLNVVNDDGSTRAATASDYTHVRWVFDRALTPGEKGAVGFRAVLL
jgi:uncharacterized repeat protein (TIGR01451 family)